MAAAEWVSTKSLPEHERILKWSPYLHFERVLMREHKGGTTFRVKCQKCGREVNEEKVAAHLEAHDRAAEKKRIASVLGTPTKPLPGQLAMPGLGVEDVPLAAEKASVEHVDVWADKTVTPFVGTVNVTVVARSGVWIIHKAPLAKRKWEVTHAPTGRPAVRCDTKAIALRAMSALSLLKVTGSKFGAPVRWDRDAMCRALRSGANNKRVLLSRAKKATFRTPELGVA